MFQSFDQWVAEAALTFEFAPPFEMLSRNWSVVPFAKYIATEFDAANPFIDPLVVRNDRQWIVGAMFNAPIAKGFGVSATVQYDKVELEHQELHPGQLLGHDRADGSVLRISRCMHRAQRVLHLSHGERSDRAAIRVRGY